MIRANEEWAALISTKVSDVQKAGKPKVTLHVTSPNAEFARTIDHTLLKPDATPAQIDALCDEAIKFKFKSCCVNGANIPQVTARLAGTSTIPCAVIGFPLGASKMEVKAFEASQAISDGAKEIDMVLNVGALKAGDYSLVFSDIRAVVLACGTTPLKVILETVFLTDEEIIAASFLAANAGATFVKTCTGFLGGGATARHVSLMRTAVAFMPGVQVKASAGIRNFEKCVEMLEAGADRIGTSSGVAIMGEGTSETGTY
ncbi:deoxyribose-phosphate aldolase [Armillaria solidipes]|uniref:deoxyribose-phosphate aldolase n=1 Tax=Armillaria solidipes TaxID=1076256 RepID=A0A2H3CKW5_9AGAR|nr:deoxyribose-phosphate aldolase [Armillaria solidipes]